MARRRHPEREFSFSLLFFLSFFSAKIDGPNFSVVDSGRDLPPWVGARASL
jgi:hypothetical protein